MKGCLAIVPAAGKGRRFGGNKVLASLKGRAVIAWTLQALQQIPEISEIIPVVSEEIMEDVLKIVELTGITKVKKVVPGGQERPDSVKNALHSIDETPERVLIHDGVRPLVTDRLIKRVIKSLGDYDGVIPGITPHDTVKDRDGDVVKETLNRNQLILVQTPQVFRYDLLSKGYEMDRKVLKKCTDDAQVVELAGGRIRIVDGEDTNIKITRPVDLALAELILEGRV